MLFSPWLCLCYLFDSSVKAAVTPTAAWHPAGLVYRPRVGGLSCLNQRTKVHLFLQEQGHPEKRGPASDQENNGDDRETAVGAPFMCSYPRYRIDLTRVKRFDSDESNIWVDVFSSWSRPSKRSIFQECSKQFPGSRIQIVERETTTISRTKSSREDHHFSFPTCQAMWELWTAAADVQRDGISRVIVFLDSRLDGVAQNFVDLIRWAGNENEKLASFFPILAEQYKLLKSSSSSPIAVHLTLKNSYLPQQDDVVLSEITDDQNAIIERTRSWVQRVLVQMGICPFTRNKNMSGQGLSQQGVPVGTIAYHTSTWRAVTAVASERRSDLNDKGTELNPDAHLPLLLCPLLADTWDAMYEMLLAGPNGKQGGISSILLAAPEFDDYFPFWAGPLFTLLEHSVVAAQAEAWLGVVCFHPRYEVNDGSSWPGFGHMHSVPRLQQWVANKQHLADRFSWLDIAAGGAWQRRTPHATINVLRADQLAAAENVRSSKDLYPRNIQLLMELGSAQLYQDLESERNLHVE